LKDILETNFKDKNNDIIWRRLYELEKQKIWQWIKIIWFYCLNKRWYKLNIICTKGTKVTTCVSKNEGWCPWDLYLYYPIEPFKNSSTF
jgi:hypothetical protein